MLYKQNYFEKEKQSGCFSNNKKFGLMFSEIPFKSVDYDLWDFDRSFLERLLAASHPSTKNYACEREKVVPVFNDFGSEENNYKIVKDIQESIRKKHLCIIEKVLFSPFFEKEKYFFFRKKHINACSKISTKHIELQYALLKGQMENFGYQTTAKEHMASLISLSSIIQKLKKNIRLLHNDLMIAHIICSKGNRFVPVLFYKNAMRKIKKELKSI